MNVLDACNELVKLLELVKTENSKNCIAENKCKWNFISPSSPHFGGLWEAGVESPKTHLRKIVGNTPLSEEKLNTVFCQIEACLNSRPLCQLSVDPKDSKTLTPGHFLTEAPFLAFPNDRTNNMLGHTKRWELVRSSCTHSGDAGEPNTSRIGNLEQNGSTAVPKNSRSMTWSW